MAKNTFKVRNPNDDQKPSLWSRMESALSLDRIFEEGLPVRYLPKVLFLLVIGVFYIGNNHYGENTLRKIDRLEEEVEDLRADYTTLKSDLMFKTKQSEVAKRVAEMGLEESLTPPTKIEVKED
ncbi:MAG: FtsL-like putative cell division protein [Bacteroidota bacterium]